MKFADEAIKSRATRRSNSTWSSSGSAGCPARKVERRLVMIGVRFPEEGGPVGIIFPPASFGNLLLMGLVVPNGQLGEPRLATAIKSDIAGEHSHARALDADAGGPLRDIHRRVGAGILFESSAGQTEKVAHSAGDSFCYRRTGG